MAERRFPLISEGYFLLNQAYKGWRLPDGHFTKHPKIAALQCVVISRLQPFFPLQFPVDQMEVGAIKCNEIFACSYALGILERDLRPDTPEKIDFGFSISSVHERDKPAINGLICVFELLSEKGDGLRSE
jgi:hypothetical protein